MKIKAITLYQPWASLWAAGIKIHETRSWPTSHRGLLVVHAAQKRDIGGDLLYGDIPHPLLVGTRLPQKFYNLPFGALVGIVDIVECLHTGPRFAERPTDFMLGDFSVGRFAWKARNPRLFHEPIPFKGRQGFFNVDIPI